MATSGIAGAINSRLRMSGMVSGLDTDSLIKQLMATEQAKVNRVIQKRDLNQWKIDSYRDVMSTLQSFYSQYFDTISPQNIKSENAFSGFAVAFSNTTSTQFINVTPTAGAKVGTYEISNVTTATAALVTGSSNVTKAVTTTGTPDVAAMDSSLYNNLFAFNFNGKSIQLKLDDTQTDLDGLVQDLQTKINNVIGTDSGSPKLIVEGVGGILSFRTVRPTDTFTIGTVNNEGASKLFNVVPKTESPFSSNLGNNQFQLTIGEITKTITIEPNKSYTDAESLKADIQSAIDNAYGSGSGVVAEVKDGRVILKSPDNKTFSVGYTPNNATNTILKIDPSNLSNKVNLNEKLNVIGDGFVDDIFKNADGTSIKNGDGTFSGKISFTITTGKGTSTFNFDPMTTSINDIIKKVNANTNIDVKMSYDITTNSFKIQSNTTGSTQKISITDDSGNFMGALGLTNPGVDGTDARVDVKNPDGSTNTIIRSTNQFSYNGLTFDIKKSTSDPIELAVSGDTSKTFDVIKGFVDKYNEVIDKLNSILNQKKDRNYLPLTEEQKSAMSEDQIKQWETKAKTGIIGNDGAIAETLSRLRAALYDSVNGTSLYSIGITTSSNYKTNGKLVIDERKLKDALANNPEDVSKLFTSNSDISYYTAINDSTKRSQRYKETGLAQRFSDIIQDAIRTTTDEKGNKGTLVMKAGLIGDSSEYTNILYKEIAEFNSSIIDLNSKLTEKENSLYAKFSAMESALNKMNSQSSWLSSQFSSGK